MTGSDPKQIARELLEEAHPALIGLSHWIHANPELGYQEVLASGWVQEWLTTAGFDVRTGVGGMPTALVGSYGPGPFHVAVCVEYDALPAVGHACGHNVIAAAGVGAGLALASVADQLGLKVTVLGTPAEETGGGKIGLIKAGELDGVHAAMMVHPWPRDEVDPAIIAIRSLEVTYLGKEAHAAGFPYLGVNAADALVIAQTAIALLRQQLTTTDRVHGIVTKGGDAANIIPSRTQATWMVRGKDVARLDEVTAKVRRCFEAGALATGCSLEIVEEICYADVRHDPDLARLYRANGEALGRVFSDPAMPVSTDMGNVSYVVPAIHPMIGIEANGAVNHQADFAAACATPSADQAIFDGALALAWTAIDAAQDVAIRERLMTFRPDPAEVNLVSSAWLMPPAAASAVAAGAITEPVEDLDPVEPALAEKALAEEIPAEAAEAMALGDKLSELFEDGAAGQVMVIPADELAADAADAAADADLEKVGEAIAELDEDLQPNAIEAVILGEQLADLMDGPAVGQVTVIGADELAADKALADAVAEAELEAEAALEVEPQAEVALDPDAAWAADVRAVEEEIRAASMTDLPEGMAAEPVSDIEFVGFDEPAETEAPAAVADASSFVEPDAEVLDVWVTPEVLGAWREEEPAAQAVASEPSDKDAAPRVAIETQGPDEEFASDAWFATAAPVAESTPAAGSTSVAKPAQVVEANVDGAAQPARAVEAVTPAPTPPSARPIEDLRDRDAWERAFEDAAAKLGWEEQFEAALRERMTDEGMDRSEAMADLAGDLQGAAPGSDAPATLPPGWTSTGATDGVSRDRIEAEGFSFVAPDLGAHDEPFTDAWSRNGNGHGTDAHAGEDLRLR
jgi:amidohydrolase